jgi:hypothetical protein
MKMVHIFKGALQNNQLLSVWYESQGLKKYDWIEYGTNVIKHSVQPTKMNP